MDPDPFDDHLDASLLEPLELDPDFFDRIQREDAELAKRLSDDRLTDEFIDRLAAEPERRTEH
jgi:hypothetical protein